MAARRGDSHRLIRWLWTSRRIDARLVRAGLVPLAGLWRAAASARNLAFDRGWIPVRDLSLPTVAVGNLTVGGSGKTPIAGWIAARWARQGRVPGILLRGYGHDEVLVHQRTVPDAVVVADADRVRGAELAAARGAEVLVLDDAFQRRDVWRDLNILLVAAESARAVRWCLPAGPWREPAAGARRADCIIVTRKRADAATAAQVAREFGAMIDGPVGIVHLGVAQYRGMVTGRTVARSELANRRVVAASAIANPEAFIAQTKATGAQVQAATWRDHHSFRDEDVAWLARAARKADFVILTEKDAVKLRDRWPASIPEPLVAELEVQWEDGQAEFEARLDGLLRPPGAD
ncbi:MAG: tetraacyldisaccharide 4'-kinase [Gemmatimonadales bacterium]|nr:tetraacyldisaccharide 4'-kinase [Gemmatimonadales bacterium]